MKLMTVVNNNDNSKNNTYNSISNIIIVMIINTESHEGSYLFQRLSVLIQRFNAVLLHDCFVDEVQVIPANFVVFCNLSNF